MDRALAAPMGAISPMLGCDLTGVSGNVISLVLGCDLISVSGDAISLVLGTTRQCF